MLDIAASLTDDVLTKRCSACQEQLPLTMFYKKSGRPGKLVSQCKKCTDKRNVVNSQLSPIKRQTNSMLRGAEKRAKSKQLEFNIDLEYVRSLVVLSCPILGISLEWSVYREKGVTKPLAESPSLDRIDPAKGYVKGNVWIISHRANAIKNDATHEELKLVTKAVGKRLVESLEF
jgi:hypothetical protein